MVSPQVVVSECCDADTTVGSPTLTQMLQKPKPHTAFQYPMCSGLSTADGDSTPKAPDIIRTPASEPQNRILNRSGVKSLGIRRRLRSVENSASPNLRQKRTAMPLENPAATVKKTRLAVSTHPQDNSPAAGTSTDFESENNTPISTRGCRVIYYKRSLTPYTSAGPRIISQSSVIESKDEHAELIKQEMKKTCAIISDFESKENAGKENSEKLDTSSSDGQEKYFLDYGASFPSTSGKNEASTTVPVHTKHNNFDGVSNQGFRTASDKSISISTKALHRASNMLEKLWNEKESETKKKICHSQKKMDILQRNEATDNTCNEDHVLINLIEKELDKETEIAKQNCGHSEAKATCTSPILSNRRTLRKRLKRRKILYGKEKESDNCSSAKIADNKIEAQKNAEEVANSSFLSDGLDLELLAVDLNEKFEVEYERESNILQSTTISPKQNLTAIANESINASPELKSEIESSTSPGIANTVNKKNQNDIVKPMVDEQLNHDKRLKDFTTSSTTGQARANVTEESHLDHLPSSCPCGSCEVTCVTALSSTCPPQFHDSNQSNHVLLAPVKQSLQMATPGFNEDCMTSDDELLALFGDEIEQKQLCSAEIMGFDETAKSKCQAKFAVEDKGKIQISERTIKREINVLGPESQHVPSEKDSQAATIGTRRNEKLNKISSGAIERARKFLDSLETAEIEYLHKIRSDSHQPSARTSHDGDTSRETAGEKAVNVSNVTIKNAEEMTSGKTEIEQIDKIQSGNNQPYSHTDTNHHSENTFVGFQTASMKPVIISDAAMKKAKELVFEKAAIVHADKIQSDDQRPSTFSVLTANHPSEKAFAGFKTASMKPVEISDAAMKKAKEMVLETAEIVRSDNVQSENRQQSAHNESVNSFVGFKTASMKPVKISDAAMKKAADMIIDCGMLPPNNPNSSDIAENNFVGFQTAGNKPISISNAAMKRAEYLLGDDIPALKMKNETDGFVVFHTASKKPVTVSQAAIEKAEILLTEDSVLRARGTDNKENVNLPTAPSSLVLTNLFKEGSRIGRKRNKEFKAPKCIDVKITSKTSSGSASVKPEVKNQCTSNCEPSPKKFLGVKHHNDSQIIVSDESLVKAVEMFEDLFS